METPAPQSATPSGSEPGHALAPAKKETQSQLSGPVWERLPDEPSLWFERFDRYRLRGTGRSLLGTVNDDRAQRGAKRTQSVPGAWHKQFTRWQWATRVAAYDRWEAERLQALWTERRERQRDREWELAQKIVEKAEAMLGFPLASRTVTEDEDGKQTRITITPAKWGFASVAALADVASKLMRLSVGLPVQTVAHVDSEGKDYPVKVVRELSDAELVIIASGGRLQSEPVRRGNGTNGKGGGA